MRIGYDVTSLRGPKTGVGYYTQHLLIHLLEVGAENEYLLLSNWPPENGLVGLNGFQVPTRYRFPIRSIWMQLFLPLALRTCTPDICHFTNFVAPLAGNVPYVVTIHDMTLSLFPQFHSWRKHLVIRPLLPAVTRKAQAIIAVSESARRDIVRLLKVPETKVRVIHEAAAPAFRPLCAEELTPIITRYHLDPSRRYILYVGTIEPRKNLVRLIDALHQIHCQGLPVDLLVVGSRGLKADDVFRRVEEHGLERHVRFVGYVPLDDLVGLYNASHVLAFPSVYECFGLPVVEAMACGLPVVTSRTSSFLEIVDDAALMVDPMSTEEIAAAIRCVLVDPELALCLRERGIQRTANFSWARAARSTLDLYREVVNQGVREA